MREIERDRRRMLESEVRMNTIFRQDLKKYETINHLVTVDQIVGADKNYFDFKTDIAEATVPFNRLFADMALQEHLRQNPYPRVPLLRKFKVEVPFEKGLSVLRYHKKKEGEDVGFIPDSYRLQYGKKDIKWILDIDFVKGEIDEVSFIDNSYDGRSSRLSAGNRGEMPVAKEKYSGDFKYNYGRLLYVPSQNVLVGEGKDYEHRRMGRSEFVGILKQSLDHVPRW